MKLVSPARKNYSPASSSPSDAPWCQLAGRMISPRFAPNARGL